MGGLQSSSKQLSHSFCGEGESSILDDEAGAAPMLNYPSDDNPTVEFFQNSKNLKIFYYSWRCKKPRAEVFLVHGFTGHAKFDWLRHNLPEEPKKLPVYEGSWVQRFNQARLSVTAIDLQGHGCSDGWTGRQCAIEEFDDLAEDVVQWLCREREACLEDEDQLPRAASSDHEGSSRKSRRCSYQLSRVKTPAFLLGCSLGGFVVLRALELLNKRHILRQSLQADYPLISGVVALAPMLSLERLKSKPVNRMLLSAVGVISRMCPHAAVGQKEPNTVFPSGELALMDDPLTYKGKIRALFAAKALDAVDNIFEEMPYIYSASSDRQLQADSATVVRSGANSQATSKKPQLATPILLIHADSDTFCDPEGSLRFFQTLHTNTKHLTCSADARRSSDGTSSSFPFSALKITPLTFRPSSDDLLQAASPEPLECSETRSTICTLWQLHSMWHWLVKEPQECLLQRGILNQWILPIIAANEANSSDEMKPLGVEQQQSPRDGKPETAGTPIAEPQ